MRNAAGTAQDTAHVALSAMLLHNARKNAANRQQEYRTKGSRTISLRMPKIEERIVEPNKTSDHSGDITEMTSADSSKISIQPPLPVMKNADQRKEWLRNYKEWGLWYTDEHIGARYYKYDFENGTRLIVEEYDPEPVRNSPWAPYEPHYMHLVGGPEPERNNGWTYHSKYNKYPNSETELVEFLKGVQK